jgi:lytic murein transglycosylase
LSVTLARVQLDETGVPLLQAKAVRREKRGTLARRAQAALRTVTLCGAAAAMLGAAHAQTATCGDSADGFDDWLADFKQEAETAGVAPSVIESALADVAYDDAVIAQDRRQGSFHQDFAKFAAKRVTAYRLKKGRTMLLSYAEPLDRIERRYGVPAPVLVAIWGLETEFGAGSGTVPTFNALATLAYDCRRSEKFREELLDALKIVQRGDLEPSQMRGAWAGEIGQTQFLPSTYLKYAVRADGGAVADLIDDPKDALASTANFLRAKGWKRGAGWDEGEPNFAALQEWNSAPVYAKTIAYFADRLAGAGENGGER